MNGFNGFKGSFDEPATQADATLALPLRRLTSMERAALEAEATQLGARWG